jgi:hypothetical membrane protein
MKIFKKELAGLIMFLGTFQWLMMILILESYQPEYISAFHYVSTLGVGATAFIYNLSIGIFGLCIISGSILSLKTVQSKIFSIFLLLTGVFILSLGYFPENIRPAHGYVTAFTFIFAVISVLFSFKVLKAPLSHISFIIGLISLVVMIIFFPYFGLPAESTTTFLGLGKGTMERILIYLLMVWMLLFSCSLLKTSERVQ